MSETTPSRRTPLYDAHVAAGARIVDFAGWQMPVQYAGLMEEHRAVRTAAGLFDVCHMGEVRVAGPGAEAFLQRLTPNDVAKLAVGRAHYSALLTPEGTFIDDLLVYRLGPEEFMLVVNASNAAGDLAWIVSQPHPDCEVTDLSDETALIAIQGPRALAIATPLASLDPSTLKYYGFARGEVAGVPALISRTGYTGEDGLELYVPPAAALGLWERLMEAGREHGLVPAGLGARDTLRMEAGMALYGHEIDRTTTPLEAGLDWVVKLDKGEFLGHEVLRSQKEQGIARRLVGFEITGRGIARQGHLFRHGGAEVGAVTSGTFAPTLEKALGMGYLPVALATPGTEISVDVRGRELPARVVPLPFYRRAR
jgi:aminomethyltransferase